MLLSTRSIRSRYVRQALSVLLAVCFFSQQTMQAAAAGSSTTTPLPAGGAYVAGSGSIKTSGNAVTINQSTLLGIIDWNTFSIGQAGMVTFRNAGGATLNRVTSQQMSSILGSLFASGSVYLINPQGILVGPGAHINTGGDFVASTLDIPNQLFLQGAAPEFQGNSPNLVVNLGSIFSQDGSVFLIGHGIQNAGSIRAPNGTAGLAAGSDVLLKDSTGDQRVFVQAPGGDINNTGVIAAAQAELKAMGGNIYALAGNNGGLISATGTANIGGDVWLVSNGGTSQVTGTISAKNADGTGGQIETSGHNLDISHATVKTGQGGNWLLDPYDLLIDGSAASTIENSLATTSVTVETSASGASGPGTQNSSGNGDITLASSIAWSSNNSLTLSAYRNIALNNGVTISNSGAGNLTLRADNTSTGTGTVTFGPNSNLNWSQSTGIVSLLYNPTDNETRYDTPTNFSSNFISNSSWVAPANNSVSNQMTAYMLVNSSSDLAALTNTGVFALGTNLNISSNSNFTELATSSPGFSGIFDGFGNTITGLTMTSIANPLGLFGYVAQGGIVRNLTLDNVSITANFGSNGTTVGGLVGNNSGTIANVTMSGTVRNYNGPYITGGVVGTNASTGLLYNVQSSVAVDESSMGIPPSTVSLGGIAGQNAGSIVNSTASGTITGNGSDYVGGMVGYNTGSITNSSSSAAITDDNGDGVQSVGGLVGYNTGTVTGVSASGTVEATTTDSLYIGGLIGWGNTPLSGVSATGNVTTTSPGAQAGGLVGHQESTIDSSNATGTVSTGSLADAGGLVGDVYGAVTNSTAGGTVTSTASSFAGGLVGVAQAGVSGSSASGSVTVEDGSTVGGLVGSAGGAVTSSSATGVVYAGSSSFAGGLVGVATAAVSGSTASGSVSVANLTDAGGLVGQSSSTISNSNATGDVSGSTGTTAGGLVGAITGPISNSFAQGTVAVRNNGYGGGLAGTTGDSVTNSYATGNVQVAGTVAGGTYVGGLVGQANGSDPISGSYATGDVSTASNGSGRVGGLIGVNYAPLNDVNATGTVSAGNSSYAGGLVGYNYAAITDANAIGTVTVGNSSYAGGLVAYTTSAGTISAGSGSSYATGTVTAGNGSYAGGLVGYDNAALNGVDATGAVTAGNSSYAGGLIGYGNAALTGVNATGAVSSGSSSYTGGLVGYTTGTGTIASSNATGNVSAGNSSNLGGLAGYTLASITNSYATGTITGLHYGNVGGLVGYTNSSITGSYATGNVSDVGGISSNVVQTTGGLVGEVDTAGSVSTSYATGNVTGTGNNGTYGGLIGTLNGTVTADSNATGIVNGGSSSLTGGLIGSANSPLSGFTFVANVQAGENSTVGGLVGKAGSTVSNSSTSGTVTGAASTLVGGLAGYVLGAVTNSSSSANVIGADAAMAGGLVGEASGNVSGSVATGNVTGGFAVGGLIGFALGNVDSSSASGTVTANQSVSDPDGNIAGGLIGMNSGSVTNSHATGTVTAGDGVSSCSGPCNMVGGLVGWANGANNQIVISNSYATGNVSAGQSMTVGGLVGWNGDAITQSYATGAVLETANGSAGGLVGYSFGAITQSYATGNVTAGYDPEIGGLAGGSSGTISHSYSTGNVSAGDDASAGGLVGNSWAAIDHSYATGNVTAGTSATFQDGCYCTSIGGLVGYGSAPISTSFATGSITSQGVGANVGGLVGFADTGTAIQQSYATGAVIANGQGVYAGGLVGYSQDATTDSYATGSVTASGSGSIAGGLVGELSTGSWDPGSPSIASSYSIGAVSGATTLGGLVGLNEGSNNITAAYWDTTTSGQTTSAGGTGLTTKQWLTLGPAATANSSWDFTNTWVQGYPYPVLAAFPYVVATVTPSGDRIYGAADPSISLTAAVDQNGNNALGLLQGTFTPVTPVINTNVGVNYNLGGAGQSVPGFQLTYSGSLNIDPATLSFTGLVANNKVYDATTTATLSLGSLALSGLLQGDNVSINTSNATANFTGKNAGTGITVDVTGLSLTGPGAGNYVIAPIQTTTANITPAPLTLSGVTTAASKTYDGTTAASVSGASIAGVLSGDSVNFVQSAAFSDKNAGTDKTVTYTNSLAGPDASNYFIEAPTTGTTTANIFPATLTEIYTANNKVYDGTTTATVAGSLSGVVPGDSVALQASFNFSDPNAGTGKTVTASNAVLIGADAANYVFTLQQNGTAAISQAPLYYVADTGVSRSFGNNNPALTGVIQGLVDGQSLNSVASGTPVFSTSATIGSPAGSYAVLGSGLTLINPNYVLAQASGNATAFTINPITISISSASKYSGSPDPALTITYNGPNSDYLQSVLANLALVYPTTQTPGTYPITVALPAALAGSILIQPGSLTILSLNNALTGNNTPTGVATLPAALETVAPPPPSPLPSIGGDLSATDQLLPGNAIGQFQVVFTPTQSWLSSAGPTAAVSNALSTASFTQTSPDGRTTGNKSTYAAGAQK